MTVAEPRGTPRYFGILTTVVTKDFLSPWPTVQSTLTLLLLEKEKMF